MPRHIHVATWIGVSATVIAAAIALLNFVTGKNKLGDFFATENKRAVSRGGATGNNHPFTRGGASGNNKTTLAESGNSTGTSIDGDEIESNLDQILDLWTPKLTQLESKSLNEKLDGKTVTLFGYLVDSRSSPLFGSSAEISPSKDAERTLYLNIDPSDKESWVIPKGSYIGVRTTLKQPLMGRIVGTKTKLIQVGKNSE